MPLSDDLCLYKKQKKTVGDYLAFFIFWQSINGVDFRKSMFIFLSNTGGKQLTLKTLEAWKEGRKREDITYQELEELVQVKIPKFKGNFRIR